MNLLFIDPTWVDFYVALWSCLYVTPHCCKQRGLHLGYGSHRNSVLWRIPPLHQQFGGQEWRAKNASKPRSLLEFRWCSWQAGHFCSCPQQNPSFSPITKSVTFPSSVHAFPNRFHNCARPWSSKKALIKGREKLPLRWHTTESEDNLPEQQWLPCGS